MLYRFLAKIFGRPSSLGDHHADGGAQPVFEFADVHRPLQILLHPVAIGIHDGGKVRRDLKESGDGLIARDAFGASYIRAI